VNEGNPHISSICPKPPYPLPLFCLERDDGSTAPDAKKGPLSCLRRERGLGVRAGGSDQQSDAIRVLRRQATDATARRKTSRKSRICSSLTTSGGTIRIA